MERQKKNDPNWGLLSTTRIDINGERWFTYQQLCRNLKIAPATMYAYVKDGRVLRKRIDGLSFYRVTPGYM